MPSPALARAIGIAAAFALVAAGFGALDLRLEAALRGDGALVGQLVASHFVHAQFRFTTGIARDAKVVYEHHGGWFDVFATGIDTSYRVAVVTRGAPARERPERFVKRGDAYVLALPMLGPIEALELRDGGGRLVARVRTPTSPGR